MVKWTSDLDQVLLIKVLETCEVRPTTKEFEDMANSWRKTPSLPLSLIAHTYFFSAEHLERPTARAISEHLWVIKKNAKATMSDKAAKNGTENPTPKSTPKKNGKAGGKNTPAKTPTKAKGGAGGKRKRVVEDEEEPTADLSDGVELALKTEDLDDEFDEMFQGAKKSCAVPNSSQAADEASQPVDEAGLMYDGTMEAI
ncbi:MAG: hypothetical protein Q9195_008924 [Heterodermia aff. obscurata]